MISTIRRRLGAALLVLALAPVPGLAQTSLQQPCTDRAKCTVDPVPAALDKLYANDLVLLNTITSPLPQVVALQAQVAALQAVSGKLPALQNGTLDGVVIGSITPAAGFFTTLSAPGGLAGNASTASALANLRTLSATGDATCSFLFDGSANAACTLTLAASGVAAGSYGSATVVPAVTVDAKGRVTGVAATPIAFPVTSVAGRSGAVALGVADVAGAAPLASPAFTGAPTVPTAAAGTSTTQAASTAFAAAAVAAETSRAQGAESANASNIAANGTAISNEVTRAQNAEALLAPKARQVIAGTGLTGGGDLSSDRTISLGSVASGAILANLTGASAAPSGNTLSAILDGAIGSARGTLAVRGASSWVPLALGASGTTLQSNGTDVVFAAASPGTGAVRYDATQGLAAADQARARGNIASAASGANADLTSLSGLTTPLSLAQGGVGSGTASGARANLGAAASGTNADITSLAGPALGAATATAPAAADSSTRVPTTGFLTAAAPRFDLAQSPTLTQQLQGRQNLGNLGSGVSAKTAAYAVVATDAGRLITGSGTWALTLPSAATVGNGFVFQFANGGTGQITVTPNGAQTVGGLASLVVNQRESGTLVSDGANWQAVGFTPVLVASGNASGRYYERYSNGYIRQWGSEGSGDKAVTFPIPFASVVNLAAAVTSHNGGASVVSVDIGNVSLSGFTGYPRYASAGGFGSAGENWTWKAEGY